MDNIESEGWFRQFMSMLGPSDIVAFLAAIIGAIATVYTTIKTQEATIISLLISQIFLLIGWGYVLRNRCENIIKLSRKDADIELLIEAQAEKDTDYEKKCVQLEKMRDLIIKQLFVISNAVKSNNIHSNDILVKIPSTTGEQYEMLEKLKAISDETKENKKLQAKLRNDAQESAQKYAVQLFGIFNRYCRDSTDEALKLQNAYLELKQIHLNVSITIKLMMKPFHPGIDNIDDNKVYTAFRDNATYNDGDREVGQQSYSISGNSAFIACIRKDYFIINNSENTKESYSNEHRGYDEFYNCAIVVPIRLKRADGNDKFFGYLCCDCLNKDSMITQVFDKSAGQYLFAFAQNIATFLETLDANWVDRYQGISEIVDISSNILEMLCKKIYKPKN